MSISGKKILIIDDDIESCKLVNKILEAAGVDSRFVHSVDDGLRMAKDFYPHLIILDVKMPERSGFEFLIDQIKDPALKSIPVLMLSAVSETSAVKKAIALGASNYLSKPIQANIILQKIRRTLIDSERELFFEFPDLVDAKIVTPCTLEKMSETEILFSSSVKFTGATNAVTIQSDLLKSLEIPFDTFKPCDERSILNDDSSFQTRLSFIGLSEAISKSIRKKIGLWK